MPWTTTKGETWESKFRAIKAFCEHYSKELDRILQTSKTPKESLPHDWALREALISILNRIKEVEAEELGDPVEVLSNRFTVFADNMAQAIERTLEEYITPKEKDSVTTELEAKLIKHKWAAIEKRIERLEQILINMGQELYDQIEGDK